MPRKSRRSKSDRAKRALAGASAEHQEIIPYDPHKKQLCENITEEEEEISYNKDLENHLLEIGNTNPNPNPKICENPGKVWGYYSMGKRLNPIINMMVIIIDMLSVVNNEEQHFNARYYMDCHKEYIKSWIIENIKNGCDGIKIVIGGSIRSDRKNNYDDITPKKLVDEFVEMLKEIVPENFPFMVLSYSEKQEIYYGETCVDDVVCLLGNHRICRHYRTHNAERLLGIINANIESCVGTYFDEKGNTRNVLLATSDFNNNSNKHKKEKGLTSFCEFTDYYLKQKNCIVRQIAMETKEQSWKIEELINKGLRIYRL